MLLKNCTDHLIIKFKVEKGKNFHNFDVQPELKGMTLFLVLFCFLFFQAIATAIGTPLPHSPAFVAANAVLIFTVMKWIQVCLEKSAMNLSYVPFILFICLVVLLFKKKASSLVTEVYNFASA